MLRAKANEKAGTSRLLLFCMPCHSATHTVIRLFVFAFNTPKFFGALDACSTSKACVRKVGYRQCRPKNSIQKFLPIWFNSLPIFRGSAAGAAALIFIFRNLIFNNKKKNYINNNLFIYIEFL